MVSTVEESGLMESNHPIAAGRVLSVGALNSLARSAIETALPLLWVSGEISNLTRATSGHWYFSLKDEQAQVRCAMFRGRNQFVDWQAANGDLVEVRAVPTLYEARGEFQLQVEVMRRAGLGALFEAFEKLKQRLAAEGLFAETRKRPLPVFPAQIGIVTSPEAAALRDVLTTLRRRAPWLKLVLFPTPVQGGGAGAKIADAIRLAGTQKNVQALIICRGGGSIEDLWAFNEEVVARAIAASPVPVVSGVGHETDFTIADFVADLRAPTPTAAAELICNSRDEWMQRLIMLSHQLGKPLHRQLTTRAQQLDQAARRLTHPEQRLQAQHQTLHGLAQRLRNSYSLTLERMHWRLNATKNELLSAIPDIEFMQASLSQLHQRLSQSQLRLMQQRHTALQHLSAQLGHLNPDAVLARGYSVVRNAQGKVIRDSKQIMLDEPLELRFQHGGASARVTEKH